jgi:2'-5' RNA ligase
VRTFIAFQPPEAVRRQIGRLQTRLQAAGTAVRWVKPKNVHLTLKFLGDSDPALDAPIRRAMQAAVAGQGPLELALGGLGGFPSLSRPRVLWLAVNGEIERLQRLQADLEAGLAAIGFAPERRPSRAHLTVGRIRRPGRWRHAAADAAARREAPSRPFRVDTLIWYASELLPDGARYTALAREPLRE